MFSVRRGLVTFACVPLLLVGACGDDTPKSNGPGTPSPSASTSASPSPSESESVLPEDQPASEVSPEQIVHAWFEAYNELALTGNATRMRDLSANGCDSCSSIATKYERVFEQGGEVTTVGDPTSVVSIQKDSRAPEGTTRLRVDFKFSPGTSRESKDSEAVHFQVQKNQWVFDLAVIDGHWQVQEVGA